MPELKAIRDGWEDEPVDWSTFAYKNKAQETKRIAAEAAGTAARDSEREKRREKRKLNTAWSAKVEKKEERELRKAKKSRKRKWLEAQGTGEAESQKKVPEDVSVDEESDSWEELAREERMAKKVRKGVVDQKMFDAEFGADL